MNFSQNFTPEWSKKIVWYQIFPERFRNGNTAGNPTKESIEGTYPFDNFPEWQCSDWGSDWYKLQPWEKRNLEKFPNKGFWTQVYKRRYGGDLQGIIDKLDYLKELGIGGIYLNPVFHSPSLHKYDGTSYHHIDPYLGANPVGDLELISKENPENPASWCWTSADLLAIKLIEEVHQRNMYIIFDGVFNHVGFNNFAFQDLLKNEKKSKFKKWFFVKKWSRTEKNQPLKYKCWANVRELPEWRQNKNGIVHGPREYIFESTRRWMTPTINGKTHRGIDGWRLDVALLIKHPFWKEWRLLAHSLNPEAYLVAESFDKAHKIKPFLQGDEFDAVMNYNFAFICQDYFANQDKPTSVNQFDSQLTALREAFPASATYSMQNLFDSHDTARISTFIENTLTNKIDRYNTFSTAKAEKSKIITGKPSEEAYQILKLMTLFQMTYVGAPMVYYGTEAGMWGANDPCCRKPMIWNDIQYENEQTNPDQSKAQASTKVEFDHELFYFFKKIIGIRNAFKCLQIGDYKTSIKDKNKNIFAFERTWLNETILVILNNGFSQQTIELSVENSESYFDLLNDNQQEINVLCTQITIKPKWGTILLKKTI